MVKEGVPTEHRQATPGTQPGDERRTVLLQREHSPATPGNTVRRRRTVCAATTTRCLEKYTRTPCARKKGLLGRAASELTPTAMTVEAATVFWTGAAKQPPGPRRRRIRSGEGIGFVPADLDSESPAEAQRRLGRHCWPRKEARGSGSSGGALAVSCDPLHRCSSFVMTTWNASS